MALDVEEERHLILYTCARLAFYSFGTYLFSILGTCPTSFCLFGCSAFPTGSCMKQLWTGSSNSDGCEIVQGNPWWVAPSGLLTEMAEPSHPLNFLGMCNGTQIPRVWDLPWSILSLFLGICLCLEGDVSSIPGHFLPRKRGIGQLVLCLLWSLMPDIKGYLVLHGCL